MIIPGVPQWWQSLTILTCSYLSSCQIVAKPCTREPLLLHIAPKVLRPDFPGKWLSSARLCNDLAQRMVAAGRNGKALPEPHCAWKDYSSVQYPARGPEFGGDCFRAVLLKLSDVAD